MLHKLKTLISMHEIEQEAQQQLYNILPLPFVKKMVVLPDIHAGYTLPIGSVMLCDDVISPDAVGLDIGCGMTNVITHVDAKAIKGDEQYIFDEIYRVIPVGFSHNSVIRKSVENAVDSILSDLFEIDDGEPDKEWIKKDK